MDRARLRILSQARCRIAETSHEPKTLRQLADECGYSAFHFHRLFVKTYLETPLEFITSQRLTEARRLLCQTDTPIGEIALRIGYQSQSTFVSLFKERHGQTPTAYRANAKRNFFLGRWERSIYIPSCFIRMRDF